MNEDAETRYDWLVEDPPTNARLTVEVVMPGCFEETEYEGMRLAMMVMVDRDHEDDVLFVVPTNDAEWTAIMPYLTSLGRPKLVDPPKRQPRFGSRPRFVATLRWLRQVFATLDWTLTPDEQR